MSDNPLSSKKEGYLEGIRFLVGAKLRNVRLSDITDDTPLFTSGLMDSITFIQLVVALETKFDIRLRDRAIKSVELLDSIAKINREIHDVKSSQ